MKNAMLCVMTLALVAGCTSTKSKEKQQTAQSNTPPKLIDKRPDQFESIAADPPLSSNTHFAAGQLAEAQGDPSRAAAQYREALKLDPNHVNALFRLGALYTVNKQFNDAINIWQRYVKATSNSPAAYNNLAFCYEQAGKLSEAEEAYKAGIARDPQGSTCRVNYGLMLARHDRLDDGIAQLRMCLSPAEVQYNLGSLFEQTGHPERAKMYYQKALELDPHLMDAQTRLAELK